MIIMLAVALTAAVVVGCSSPVSADEKNCTLRDPPKDICQDLPSLNFISNGFTVDNSACGERFQPDFIRKPDQIQWWGKADWRELYTFLLIGRDPIGDYTFHWGLSNLPGHFLRGEGYISEHDNYLELADYVPVSVSHNGTTTYSFTYLALLYRQTREISIRLNISPSARQHFNLMEFADGQGLCGPLAGVQTYASPDKPSASNGSKSNRKSKTALFSFLKKLSLNFH